MCVSAFITALFSYYICLYSSLNYIHMPAKMVLVRKHTLAQHLEPFL